MLPRFASAFLAFALFALAVPGIAAERCQTCGPACSCASVCRCPLESSVLVATKAPGSKAEKHGNFSLGPTKSGQLGAGLISTKSGLGSTPTADLARVGRTDGVRPDVYFTAVRSEPCSLWANDGKFPAIRRLGNAHVVAEGSGIGSGAGEVFIASKDSLGNAEAADDPLKVLPVIWQVGVIHAASLTHYVGHWQRSCGPNGCQLRYVEDAPRPVVKANYPCKCAPGYCTCRAGECGDGKCPTAVRPAQNAPAARTAACGQQSGWYLGKNLGRRR